MKAPTELEIERLLQHAFYDPQKAHEYYLRTRELKGRKKANPKVHVYEDGSTDTIAVYNKKRGIDPRTGKTRQEIAKNAKAKQKKELQERIGRLGDRLNKLEALIKKREHEEASEDRKGKARKERAAKDRDKPKTAAEKAEDAREAKKYRDKHKQELKSESKKADGKSGGGSSKKGASKSKKHSVTELKTLATKVKGQLAVAKQKLAAL